MGKLINISDFKESKIIYIDSTSKSWILDVLDPVRFNQKNIVSNYTAMSDRLASQTDDYKKLIESRFLNNLNQVLKDQYSEQLRNKFLNSQIYRYYRKTLNPILIRCKVIGNNKVPSYKRSMKLYLSLMYGISESESLEFRLDLNKSTNVSELSVSDSIINDLVSEGIAVKYRNLTKFQVSFDSPLESSQVFELDKFFTSLSGIPRDADLNDLEKSSYKSGGKFIYSYTLNPYYMKLSEPKIIKNLGYSIYTHIDQDKDFKSELKSIFGNLFNEDMYEASMKVPAGETTGKIHATQYQLSNLITKDHLVTYVSNVLKYELGECDVKTTPILNKFLKD